RDRAPTHSAPRPDQAPEPPAVEVPTRYHYPAPTGENRIQSENAKTGDAAWKLTNPATTPPSHAWPLNDSDNTPEIEGFASSTSVNTNSSISFYVDVRSSDPNFTLEIFRMGWYGGLGARKMTWIDNGSRTTKTLPSQRQA